MGAGIRQPSEPVLVNKVDPGLQVSVRLAFDVPPGVRPRQIVLRESTSSTGAPVNRCSLHPQLHAVSRG